MFLFCQQQGCWIVYVIVRLKYVMTFAVQIVMKLGIFIIYMDPDLSCSQFLPLTNKAKYLKYTHINEIVITDFYIN